MLLVASLMSAPAVLVGQSTSTTARPLTLQEAIDRSLQRNLGLQVDRFQPALVEEDIVAAKAEFDPAFYLNGSLNELVSPLAASTLEGADRPTRDQRTYAVGVTKKLASGATVDLSTSLDREATNSSFDTLNPEQNAEITFDLNQPLLKGAGKKVNLAAVARAESAYSQAMIDFRRSAFDVLTETEIAYWNVAYSVARKELLETALEVAEQLLKETVEKERLGLATRVEVLQARAALASRQEAIILAGQQIDDSQDNLYLFMGDLQAMNPDVLVATLPDEDIEVPRFAVLYRKARELDFDTRMQEEAIQQSELDVMVARNNRRPNLDLTLQGSYLGRDEDGPAAFENAVNGDGYVWTAGVQVTVPWGLRGDNARYRRAQHILQREQLRLDSLEQELLLRLRAAWRALVAGKERLEATQASLALSEEQFEQERARFNAGLSTFRDVLLIQEDLDEARLSELDARIDTIRAAVRLARFDGSILERHGYAWEEVDALAHVQTEKPVSPAEETVAE